MFGVAKTGSSKLRIEMGMIMAEKNDGMVHIGRKLATCLAVVLVCAVFFPNRTLAQDMLTGKYLSSSGSTIVLELRIQDPPPGNIIVNQFLPKGVGLIKSVPPVTKFSSKKGKAKWLLKKVRSGPLKITMQLAKSIEAGNVRAEVRCRDQVTGKMTDIVIR